MAGPDRNWSTFVAELWGGDGPVAPGRMIVVRQSIHTVFSWANHDLVGIGPGVANQGFGGPPPSCLAAPFWTLWGVPGPLVGPLQGIYMDGAPLPTGYFDSHMLGNLALVFDAVINRYTLNVY